MANTTRQNKKDAAAGMKKLVGAGVIPKTAPNQALRTWDDDTLAAMERLGIKEFPRPQTIKVYAGSLEDAVNTACAALGLPPHYEVPGQAELLAMLVTIGRKHAGYLPTPVAGGTWNAEAKALAQDAGVTLPRPHTFTSAFGSWDHARDAAIKALREPEKPTLALVPDTTPVSDTSWPAIASPAHLQGAFEEVTVVNTLTSYEVVNAAGRHYVVSETELQRLDKFAHSLLARVAS